MPCVTLSSLLVRSDRTVGVGLPANRRFSPPDNPICHLLSSHDTGGADSIHPRRRMVWARCELMVIAAADITFHSYSLGPRCDRERRSIAGLVIESLCPSALVHWSRSPYTWTAGMTSGRACCSWNALDHSVDLDRLLSSLADGEGRVILELFPTCARRPRSKALSGSRRSLSRGFPGPPVARPFDRRYSPRSQASRPSRSGSHSVPGRS